MTSTLPVRPTTTTATTTTEDTRVGLCEGNDSQCGHNAAGTDGTAVWESMSYTEQEDSCTPKPKGKDCCWTPDDRYKNKNPAGECTGTDSRCGHLSCGWDFLDDKARKAACPKKECQYTEYTTTATTTTGRVGVCAEGDAVMAAWKASATLYPAKIRSFTLNSGCKCRSNSQCSDKEHHTDWCYIDSVDNCADGVADGESPWSELACGDQSTVVTLAWDDGDVSGTVLASNKVFKQGILCSELAAHHAARITTVTTATATTTTTTTKMAATTATSTSTSTTLSNISNGDTNATSQQLCDRINRQGIEEWEVCESTATTCKALMEPSYSRSDWSCSIACGRSGFQCIGMWHEFDGCGGARRGGCDDRNDDIYCWCEAPPPPTTTTITASTTTGTITASTTDTTASSTTATVTTIVGSKVVGAAAANTGNAVGTNTGGNGNPNLVGGTPAPGVSGTVATTTVPESSVVQPSKGRQQLGIVVAVALVFVGALVALFFCYQRKQKGNGGGGGGGGVHQTQMVVMPDDGGMYDSANADLDPEYTDIAAGDESSTMLRGGASGGSPAEDALYLEPVPTGAGNRGSSFDPLYDSQGAMYADVDDVAASGGENLYLEPTTVGGGGGSSNDGPLYEEGLDESYYASIQGGGGSAGSPKRGAPASYKAGNGPEYSYVEQTYLEPVVVHTSSVQNSVGPSTGGAAAAAAAAAGSAPENVYAVPVAGQGGAGAGAGGGTAMYEYAESQTALSEHTYALANTSLADSSVDDLAGHTYALANPLVAESSFNGRAPIDNTFC